MSNEISLVKKLEQKPVLLIAMLLFMGFMGVIIIIGARLSQSSREARIRSQEASFQAPTQTNKREVKKIRLARINQQGEEEYLEITASGQINLYDKNNNLIKSNLQGFSRINLLFNQINRYLSTLSQAELDALTRSKSSPSGSNQACVILVSTNLGDFYLPCQDVEDIQEEIEDIEEETFYPTPTPTLLPTIFLPSPTTTLASPTPTKIIITPTPGGPSPTPTPLPDYMTAPPFSCDEYDHLGRPVAISNVICGIR